MNKDTLEEVVLPNSLKKIPQYSFGYMTKLKHIHIPQGVEIIGELAFSMCKDVKIGDKLTLENIQRIDDSAFLESGISGRIIFGEKLRYIGNNAFGDTLIREIDLSKCVNLYEINSGAFKNCINLEKVILPDSIKEIRYLCFYGCEKLKQINIPKDLEMLGRKAFAKCKNLTELNFCDCNLQKVKVHEWCFNHDTDLRLKIPRWAKELDSLGRDYFGLDIKDIEFIGT